MSEGQIPTWQWVAPKNGEAQVASQNTLLTINLGDGSQETLGDLMSPLKREDTSPETFFRAVKLTFSFISGIEATSSLRDCKLIILDGENYKVQVEAQQGSVKKKIYLDRDFVLALAQEDPNKIIRVGRDSGSKEIVFKGTPLNYMEAVAIYNLYLDLNLRLYHLLHNTIPIVFPDTPLSQVDALEPYRNALESVVNHFKVKLSAPTTEATERESLQHTIDFLQQRLKASEANHRRARQLQLLQVPYKETGNL